MHMHAFAHSPAGCVRFLCLALSGVWLCCRHPRSIWRPAWSLTRLKAGTHRQLSMPSWLGQAAQRSEVRLVCERGQCMCCGHSRHASLPTALLYDPGTQSSQGLPPVYPGAQRQASGWPSWSECQRYVHIDLYMYHIHSLTHTRTQTHIHTHKHTHTHTHKRTYTYTHIFTYTHTTIDKHTHKHTHRDLGVPLARCALRHALRRNAAVLACRAGVSQRSWVLLVPSAMRLPSAQVSHWWSSRPVLNLSGMHAVQGSLS